MDARSPLESFFSMRYLPSLWRARKVDDLGNGLFLMAGDGLSGVTAGLRVQRSRRILRETAGFAYRECACARWLSVAVTGAEV